jgi:hypothetical protein
VSIRHLHWNNDRPQLGGIFNVVARALAPTDAAAAAVLQGAAHRLATTANSSPNPGEHLPGTPGTIADRPTLRTSNHSGFLTELRRATTRLLRDTLGEVRLHDLRAEGEAMDDEHAVAYARDAIGRAASTGTTGNG